jgi:hypothetical protein
MPHRKDYVQLIWRCNSRVKTVQMYPCASLPNNLLQSGVPTGARSHFDFEKWELELGATWLGWSVFTNKCITYWSLCQRLMPKSDHASGRTTFSHKLHENAFNSRDATFFWGGDCPFFQCQVSILFGYMYNGFSFFEENRRLREFCSTAFCSTYFILSESFGQNVFRSIVHRRRLASSYLTNFVCRPGLPDDIFSNQKSPFG